jgi:hypothetical protein
MTNRHHFLIQTPEGNISKTMRHGISEDGTISSIDRRLEGGMVRNRKLKK